MKKLLILLLFMCVAGISAQAETMNYKIKQDGSVMVIVPYPVQKQLLYTPPAKIPYYTNKKLPKGANRNKMA